MEYADAAKPANRADPTTVRVKPTGLYPTLDTREPITLAPAGNGGWVMEQESPGPYRRTRVLGAYTSTAEMLRALTENLVRDTE